MGKCTELNLKVYLPPLGLFKDDQFEEKFDDEVVNLPEIQKKEIISCVILI